MKKRLQIGSQFAAAAVTAAALLSSAACSIQGIPSSAWETATVDPLQPAGLPTGFPRPGAAQRAEGYDMRNTVGFWKLIQLRNGGRELVIRYSQGGGCDVPKGVFVAETDEKVAVVPMYFSPLAPCTATTELRAPTAIVTLSTALGDRQLLHLAREKRLP